MPPHSIVTPSLLSAIRSQPSLPKNTWYFVAGVALSVLNRPDDVGLVFQAASEFVPDNGKLAVARRMREALIKSAAIGGLPKTINSLTALKAVTPLALQDAADAAPTSRSLEVKSLSSATIERGQRFFDKTYGKIAGRVMGQMDNSGNPDLGWTARLMYGYVLSTDDVLEPVETSYSIIAALIPQDVNPQLKGHLKGALNHGATTEEVKAIRAIVIKICEEAGMTKLEERTVGGFGWKADVANL